jgi:hypothetical protein
MEHFLHYKISAITAYYMEDGDLLQTMGLFYKECTLNKKKKATCNIITMQVLSGEFPACSRFTIWAYGIVAALQIWTYKQYKLSK